MNRVLVTLYALLATSFCVYSYGFTDFNLTLSSHPLITAFVSWSQGLAMFNRPLSLYVYLGLVTAFFGLYLGVLTQRLSNKATMFPWRAVTILAVILAMSYPLLSADVFKYLFTGKIIVYYHANPYHFPPNHFDGDLWLRFMRWVHTPTPYGPVMSALAVPYYLLALGKFVPALYLYKLSSVGWYLLAIWCIGKLSRPSHSLANQLYFALNPLVLVEWLVNAHNDAMMISLLMLALTLRASRHRLASWTALLLSILIKYVTVIALPLVFFKNKISPLITHYYLLITLAISPLLYHYSVQYQPWYVTWLVPLAALIPSRGVRLVVAAYSLGAILRYLPYIATGLWLGTPWQFGLLTFLPPLLVALVYNGWYVVFPKTQTP